VESRLTFLRDPHFKWGFLVFAVALIVRLVGISWGLPDGYRIESLHPDEPIVRTVSGNVNIAAGKLTPGFYNYGTLYLTLNSVGQKLADAYAPVEVKTPADLGPSWRRYYMVGRVFSALAGAGLAWVVYALLRRRTNLLGAFSGAAAITFAPGLVMHSRFQTVDMVATFLATLGVFYALQLVPDRGSSEANADWWKTVAKSAIWLGLSAGTKYTGAVLLLALWGAIWFSEVPVGKRIQGALASLGILLVTLVISTPGIVLDQAQFLKDFTYELGHTSSGHGFVFIGTPPGFIQQTVNLSQALGFSLVILGFIGLAAGAWRRHKWLTVTLMSYLIFFVFIARAEVKFVRYCFPLIPLLAMGFGWLMGQCHQNPNRKWSLVTGLGAFALFGIPTGGIKDTILYTGAMSGVDPRDEVGARLRADATGKTVGLPSLPWFYSPSLYPGAQFSKMDWFRMGKEMVAAVPDPKIVYFDPESKMTVGQWLTQTKPDYVVYSTFESDDMRRILGSKTTDEGAMTAARQWKEFLDVLGKDYTIEAEWGENSWLHDLMYIHPGMVIYKKKG